MTATSSDPVLARRLQASLKQPHPVAAVAGVAAAGTAVASLGADLDADYEIGSISKGITGLLYADALDRGEVHRTTTLGELLPLGAVPAADVTLESLSIHRSGLPRLPKGFHPMRRSVDLVRNGTNPYGESLAQLLAQARVTRVGRTRPRYSNFGFELLGHALAAAADMTYPELVERRVAAPLALSSLYVPGSSADLRPSALTGSGRTRRPRQAWTGEALGPAGGIRASIIDMARLARALLDGSAAGLSALDPVAEFGRGAFIGAAWITVQHDGRSITWHNGATGGFRSWIGLDRSSAAAVVILSATSISVDMHGWRFLHSLAAGPR